VRRKALDHLTRKFSILLIGKQERSKSGLTHIISYFIKRIVQGLIIKIFWIFLSRNLEILYWEGD